MFTISFGLPSVPPVYQRLLFHSLVVVGTSLPERGRSTGFGKRVSEKVRSPIREKKQKEEILSTKRGGDAESAGRLKRENVTAPTGFPGSVPAKGPCLVSFYSPYHEKWRPFIKQCSR